MSSRGHQKDTYSNNASESTFEGPPRQRAASCCGRAPKEHRAGLTHARTQARTLALSRARTQASRMHAQMPARTHERAHALAHSRIDTRTRTQRHARPHTCAVCTQEWCRDIGRFNRGQNRRINLMSITNHLAPPSYPQYFCDAPLC
eukprot:6202635-Pleurochrysis_carterae.AAC.2